MTARRPAAGTARGRFIVVTGLSGAGKSQAIRALEDLGYFCVDNLPVALLPFMAEFAQQHATEHDRIAVVMDVREPRFTTDFPAMYRSLRKVHDPAPTLIFLEAGQAELVRRFSETRRPHPLAPDRPVTEGLAEERASLRPIKAMADKVVDTTSMNVHELRQVFLNVVAGRRQASTLVLTFLSFGFHYGVPAEADLVFDVRFLKNPHWVPALRPHAAPAAHRPVPAAHRGFSAVRVAALRRRRQSLSDGGHRLHRGSAPLGIRGRVAQAEPGQGEGPGHKGPSP